MRWIAASVRLGNSQSGFGVHRGAAEALVTMLVTATRRAASQRAPRLLLRGNFASRLLSSGPAAAGSQAAAGSLEVLQRPAESGAAYEAYSGRGGGLRQHTGRQRGRPR